MDKRGSRESTLGRARAHARAIGATRAPALRAALRLSLLLPLLAIAFPDMGQTEERERTHGFIIHPAPILLAKPSLDLQYRHFVLHAGAFTSPDIFPDVSWTGWEGSVAYRFYVARPKKADPIEGLYLAPVLAAGSGEDKTGTGQSVMLGFDVGYQLVHKKGFTVDINTGWRHRISESGTADDPSFPFLFSPSGPAEWWPGIGIGIGYSFREGF